jgi:aryl-alcohol dehydrogenase-like predicted oxidoreductase
MIEEERLIALGKTNIRISPLGLGTWSWGDRFYWGYGRGGYTDSDIRDAFLASTAGGVNFFDSAEVYGVGKSEKMLGAFIVEYQSESQTSSRPLIIASKFFPYPWRFFQGSLERALKSSLKRLGIPQLDLYQTHWPWPPRSIETWLKGMAKASKAGLVRSIGISNYNLDLMIRAQRILEDQGLTLASNQVEYHLLQRSPEKSGLLETCREREITLIAYSPIASGILTGKYTPENPPSGPRGRRYNAQYLESLAPLFELMNEIGRAHNGATYSQIALNWVMTKGAVPIPGAKNGEQATENLGALGWRLSPEEVAALDSISDNLQSSDSIKS